MRTITMSSEVVAFIGCSLRKTARVCRDETPIPIKGKGYGTGTSPASCFSNSPSLLVANLGRRCAWPTIVAGIGDPGGISNVQKHRHPP